MHFISFHFVSFHFMHFIATGVCAKRATNAMKRRLRVMAGAFACPRLAGAGVWIISECATTWQARAQASHKPLYLKVLQRAAVPANRPHQLGRDGNHQASIG
jgi:hypothetical protein